MNSVISDLYTLTADDIAGGQSLRRSIALWSADESNADSNANPDSHSNGNTKRNADSHSNRYAQCDSDSNPNDGSSCNAEPPAGIYFHFFQRDL